MKTNIRKNKNKEEKGKPNKNGEEIRKPKKKKIKPRMKEHIIEQAARTNDQGTHYWACLYTCVLRDASGEVSYYLTITEI